MLKLLNRNKEAEPIIKFYLSKKLLLSEFDLSAKEIIEVNKTFGKLNWFFMSIPCFILALFSPVRTLYWIIKNL